LTTIEAENEKLQNHVESVETEMMKVKALAFQHLNTHPPFASHKGDETPG